MASAVGSAHRASYGPVGEVDGTPTNVELQILMRTGKAGNERGSVIRGNRAGSSRQRSPATLDCE